MASTEIKTEEIEKAVSVIIKKTFEKFVDIYSSHKEHHDKEIKSDKSVLFIGTPCQIAGLKNYLGKEYPFCAVCSRELEKAFLLHCNPEKLKNGGNVFGNIAVLFVLTIALTGFLLCYRRKGNISAW